MNCKLASRKHLNDRVTFAQSFAPLHRTTVTKQLCPRAPRPLPIARRPRATLTEPGAPCPVVVASSLNADISIAVTRAPQAGETVAGGSVTQSLGGKGANTAVAAARALNRAGAVRLAAARGADGDGEALVGALRDFGVDVSLMREVGAARTGAAYIVVEADGENRIIVAPGANTHFAHVLTPRFWDALSGAIVVLHMETPPQTVLAVAQGARARGARVVFNPSPVAGVNEIGAIWSAIDFLLVNEIEAAQLSGVSDDSVAATRALAAKCKPGACVVVTRGKESVIFVQGGEVGIVDIVDARAVVDTTSAGDTVTGYFAAGIARGLGVQDALEVAVAAASITVERRGASISIPSIEEVEKRLLELAR